MSARTKRKSSLRLRAPHRGLQGANPCRAHPSALLVPDVIHVFREGREDVTTTRAHSRRSRGSREARGLQTRHERLRRTTPMKARATSMQTRTLVAIAFAALGVNVAVQGCAFDDS